MLFIRTILAEAFKLTTRICASLGLRLKFKTLFTRDEEKHSYHFDWPLFFNMSKQFLASGGLSAENVQLSVTPNSMKADSEDSSIKVLNCLRQDMYLHIKFRLLPQIPLNSLVWQEV